MTSIVWVLNDVADALRERLPDGPFKVAFDIGPRREVWTRVDVDSAALDDIEAIAPGLRAELVEDVRSSSESDRSARRMGERFDGMMAWVPKARAEIARKQDASAPSTPVAPTNATRSYDDLVPVEPPDATEPNGPVLNIVGEKVALGPLRRDLVPAYLRWVSDFEVTRTLGVAIRPYTREAEEAWYESVTKADREIQFTVYERATLRPIGNGGLKDIDHAHGTATFGILIGEKGAWGKGYGTEATRLVLDYAFTVLGLHNVLLTVFSFNERGLRAYQRAGFKELGRRREARRLAGRAYDVVYMDCLATEFESPVLRQIIAPGQ